MGVTEVPYDAQAKINVLYAYGQETYRYVVQGQFTRKKECTGAKMSEFKLEAIARSGNEMRSRL